MIGSDTDPDYLLGAGIDIKFLMRHASFHPDSDSAAVCCPITPDRGSIARDGCFCLCDLVDGHFGFCHNSNVDIVRYQRVLEVLYLDA